MGLARRAKAVVVRGRKPTPVELKLVGGNAGKRALADEASLPKVAGEPDMPPDFEGDLASEWARVVADLRAAGTLGREIGAAIEIYVRNLVRMRRAEEHVTRFGPIVPAPRTGVPMHNPHLAIANAAAASVARMVAELGLTPSSRGRVTKLGDDESDPSEAFFGGGAQPKRAPPKLVGKAAPAPKG